MGSDKKIARPDQDLFVRYSEEINSAYQGAVRDAILKHKGAGNSIAVERDGKLVILAADEIDVD